MNTKRKRMWMFLFWLFCAVMFVFSICGLVMAYVDTASTWVKHYRVVSAVFWCMTSQSAFNGYKKGEE